MKQLSKQQSKEILLKLMALFNYFDQEKLHEYIGSKPFCWKSKFFSIGNDRHTLPFLFWDGKEIGAQFDNMIYLAASATDYDGKSYAIAKFGFFKKFAEYLKNNFVNKFYGAGNWSACSGLGHNVLIVKPEELETLAREHIGVFDIYFFPKNFSWILAFNHHDFGFLAGSREFIEGFAMYYPEYRRFIPDSDSCCSF